MDPRAPFPFSALVILAVVSCLLGSAHAGDLTFSGEASIQGAGRGLTFPDGIKQVTANP